MYDAKRHGGSNRRHLGAIAEKPNEPTSVSLYSLHKRFSETALVNRRDQFTELNVKLAQARNRVGCNFVVKATFPDYVRQCFDVPKRHRC